MATSKQAKKLIEVFEDVETDPMQEILGDGLLAIIRDRRDLAQQFVNVARGLAQIRPIEHVIDLSVPCRLPFAGAERVSPAKTGIVKLEKRDDALYLDGVKPGLFLSENQKGGNIIVGHDLRKELEARGGNLGGSILDYMVVHPELWLESWKKDDQGNIIYVHFWDDIFRYPTSGNLVVRFGYWNEGSVVSYCRWLGHDWHGHLPAASCASTADSVPVT